MDFGLFKLYQVLRLLKMCVIPEKKWLLQKMEDPQRICCISVHSIYEKEKKNYLFHLWDGTVSVWIKKGAFF